MLLKRKAMTLTFGECAENHVGNQKIGKRSDEGFTLDDLQKAATEFHKKDCVTQFVDLRDALFDGTAGKKRACEAAVLIVKKGLQAFGVDEKKMTAEQDNLAADTKALMWGKVKNKVARHNLCFDTISQRADYEAGKGTIVDFRDTPMLHKVRENLETFVGKKGRGLKCEMNKYYDVEKTGIGFHGDAERKKVIAIRLGASAEVPLVFRWYLQHKPVGNPVRLTLDSGDMYIMSEKATGFDWRKPSQLTLRHAAGCDQYIM